MKKEHEIISLIKHLVKHKKLLMTKLDRANDNNDEVMAALCWRLIDEQSLAMEECIEIIKSQNNGQWRSVVCRNAR